VYRKGYTIAFQKRLRTSLKNREVFKKDYEGVFKIVKLYDKIQDMKRFKVKPECGTLSGYDYHRRQTFEAPCIPCRDAMREHWKAQRIRRNKEINELRQQWRLDEQYYRSMNNKRLHKNAKQEPYTYKQVLETYGTSCHLCDKKIDLKAPRKCGDPGWEQGLHVDHIIPLSKGGDDTLENVKPSHGQCNIIKNATLV